VRHDIAKLICERPRRGSRKDRLDRPYRREFVWSRLVQEGREEDSPLRESIRKKWGFDHKEFSDYLAPIKGFLKKSVGRPWDDVWSEISQNLSLGSATQRHVLGHVDGYVEKHAIEQEDGSITNSRGRPLNNYRMPSLYVCPRTGLLKKGPDATRRRYNQRLNVPVVRFHRVNGIWFDVTFSLLPMIQSGWTVGGHFFSTTEKLEDWLEQNYDFYRGHVRATDHLGSVHDVLVDRLVDTFNVRKVDAHWLDHGSLYCSAKRQAGKKEIRDFGLRGLERNWGGPPAVVGPTA